MTSKLTREQLHERARENEQAEASPLAAHAGCFGRI